MVHNEYYTSEGMIRSGNFHPRGGGEPVAVSGGRPRQVTCGDAPSPEFASFVHAMRSRNLSDVNADVEVGHYSSALCHLGNVSYRLGSLVPFSRANKTLGDDKQVVESFETIKANCMAVGVNLLEDSYHLGRELAFDPATEQFVADDEANAMLTRDYRRPFVVPEHV
jgi:hypothetical protein